MSHRGPIGLICLAAFAALLSLPLALFGGALLFNVVPSLMRDSHKPDYYPLGYILLIAAGICLLVVAWVAATTAVDLWRSRRRGRSLALTGAPILIVFVLWFLFGRAVTDFEFWTAFSIVILGLITMIYLCLPNIRLHFESQPTA
jgi:hypothetical protein